MPQMPKMPALCSRSNMEVIIDIIASRLKCDWQMLLSTVIDGSWTVDDPGSYPSVNLIWINLERDMLKSKDVGMFGSFIRLNLQHENHGYLRTQKRALHMICNSINTYIIYIYTCFMFCVFFNHSQQCVLHFLAFVCLRTVRIIGRVNS